MITRLCRLVSSRSARRCRGSCLHRRRWSCWPRLIRRCQLVRVTWLFVRWLWIRVCGVRSYVVLSWLMSICISGPCRSLSKVVSGGVGSIRLRPRNTFLNGWRSVSPRLVWIRCSSACTISGVGFRLRGRACRGSSNDGVCGLISSCPLTICGGHLLHWRPSLARRRGWFNRLVDGRISAW